MKGFFNRIRNILFPPSGSSCWFKLIPLALVIVIFFAVLVSGAYAWEYTNSPEFCGMQCHSMPPEYTSYKHSPHAQIKCVECHIGREFVGNQFTRKMGDMRHVIAQLSNNYEYPIEIKTMRPASETCEQCHAAEKYSDDTQKVISHFESDDANTESITYLRLKTGGGTAEEGLGTGIHWHITNDVYYYPSDDSEEVIPYVTIYDDDGFTSDYVDVTSNFDIYSVDDSELRKMDCITCHNRVTHSTPQPEDAVDELLARQVISPDIPEIKKKAVETLRGSYISTDQAMNSIGALTAYYQESYPDFYETNSEDIYQAVDALKEFYSQSVFPDQKMDWDTHADNLGHINDPGCFRCHDGKHFDISGQGIPLDCDLCHSIPVIAAPDELVTHLDINNEPQPDTHDNPNWIALHAIVYTENDENEMCSGCHDINGYETGDSSSFCGNTACHVSAVEYVDLDVFDDPKIGQGLLAQLPHYPPQFPLVEDWETPSLDSIHRDQEGMVCEDCHDVMPPVGAPPNDMCIACHGETKQGLFDLTSNLEPNPHDEHEGAGKCSFCHQNFGPPRSSCALCHDDEAMEQVENTQ